VAFRSGAALTVRDLLIVDPKHCVPVKRLANHLTLRARKASLNSGQLITAFLALVSFATEPFRRAWAQS
tara:strand:+ start:4381 stop:4587 length:207 start_codon:yes stop_codon:yes gene_type:complete